MSLKRFIGVIVFLSVLILLLNLHMTYIQGKYFLSKQRASNPFSFRGLNFQTTTLTSPLNELRRYKTISNCTNLTFPYHLLTHNRWQDVDRFKSLYVFSAYLEGKEVNVIGAAKRTGSYICQLWYTSSATSTVRLVDVKATTIDRFPESHGKTYSASRVACHLSDVNETGKLLAVSISRTKCEQPTNVLPVIQNGVTNDTNKFTVCVTPFSNKYARAYELTEWIELNRMLGADKFVFYNLSTASNVDKVLNSYTGSGLVEVVDWKPPMKLTKWPPDGVKEEIHYNGQLASLNECLLRSRGRTKFIVNLDLDEFIIPRTENVTTWEEMLGLMPSSDIYMFANVFFRKEWQDSRTNFTGYENAKKYNLVTLLRLKREDKIWTYGQRSKYIAKPEKVRTLGIHNIWAKTGSIKNVPHSVAILHHYRNWMKYEEKINRIEDEIILTKYKDKLLQNVITKWKTLPNVVQDIPLCDNPMDFGAC